MTSCTHHRRVTASLIIGLGAWAAIALGGTPAWAGPGLTLEPGQVAVTAHLEVNVSADAVGEPVSLAPDVSYGVTPRWTVGLIHSTFGVTGFRGAAGRGLCVSGEGHGCAAVYNNVGAEALYSLKVGRFAAAANVGVHALNLDAGFYAAKLGVKLRYVAGDVSVASAPSILMGLSERDLNKESIWIPVLVQFKVAPPMALGLGTGLKGPLDGFGDNWEVSLGASASYALDARMTLGAAWTFGKLIGGAETAGLDSRAAHLWYGVTL